MEEARKVQVEDQKKETQRAAQKGQTQSKIMGRNVILFFHGKILILSLGYTFKRL